MCLSTSSAAAILFPRIHSLFPRSPPPRSPSSRRRPSLDCAQGQGQGHSMHGAPRFTVADVDVGLYSVCCGCCRDHSGLTPLVPPMGRGNFRMAEVPLPPLPPPTAPKSSILNASCTRSFSTYSLRRLRCEEPAVRVAEKELPPTSLSMSRSLRESSCCSCSSSSSITCRSILSLIPVVRRCVLLEEATDGPPRPLTTSASKFKPPCQRGKPGCDRS